MKDHHRRQPLRPVSANAAPTPAPTCGLKRLENMAIGGKAGLKMRRAGGSGGSRRSRSSTGSGEGGERGGGLPEGARTPLSRSGSDTSTFALSTDVSTASAHPAEGGGGVGIRADSPLCSPLAAPRPPARSHGFVAVFEDGRALGSSTQPHAGGPAGDRPSGKAAESEKSEGSAGAQAATTPKAETGAADESADLNEEEMQECLRQLERNKAARAQTKHGLASVARTLGKAAVQAEAQPLQTQTPGAVLEGVHALSDGALFGEAKHASHHPAHFPAAPQLYPLQGRAQEEKPSRKFRVLPAVITPVAVAPTLYAAASPPAASNQPRILEVKVVTPPGSRGPPTTNEEGQAQKQVDETLSPFSAFYRETAGARGQDAALARDTAHRTTGLDERAQQSPQALSPSDVCGASDKSSQEEKSVQVAASPPCAPVDEQQQEDAAVVGRANDSAATWTSSNPGSLGCFFERRGRGGSQEPQHARAAPQPSYRQHAVDSGNHTQKNNRAPSVLSPVSGSSASQESPSPESLELDSDSAAFSREVSLAPKTQKLWPFPEQGPHGDKSEPRTGMDAHSSAAFHGATRQGSLLSIDRGAQLEDAAATSMGASSSPTAFLADSSDRADKSMPTISPKADSWSGLGVKLAPICAASLRSRDPALVGGLEIVNMEVGGPAERAGMRLGDVIVYLSNGVLEKGTSAMEATSLLQQQSGAHHVIVSRRRTSWGQQGKPGQPQRHLGSEGSRRMVAVLMRPSASSCDVAFGTDLSLGFTLRDGKDGPEEWASLPMVSDLIDGSAAHASGLRIGDVIVGIGSLEVRKFPARACISLLQGEAGSQVLLGIYHASAGIRVCDSAQHVASALDTVQWQRVERNSTFHVSLGTSRHISPAAAGRKVEDDHATLAAFSLPELSPDNSHCTNPSLSPVPAPGPLPRGRGSRAKLQWQDLPPPLSLPSADVSTETYFAYRDTADNSSAASAGSREEPSFEQGEEPLCEEEDDKSLLELRQLSARAHAERGARMPVQDVRTVPLRGVKGQDMEACRGDELDESLVELRRQARAREKRRAFLSAEAKHKHAHADMRALAPRGAAKTHRVLKSDARAAQPWDYAHGKDSGNEVLPHTAETAAASVTAAPAASQGAQQDRRFAMMRTMLLQHDEDDSLLEWMRQTEAAGATAAPQQLPAQNATCRDVSASASSSACDPHACAGPARGGGGKRGAEGDTVSYEPRAEAALKRERAGRGGAYRRGTPPKPVTPNVKVLGGVELERAAWKYVHQHEIRSQVSLSLSITRARREYETCVCVCGGQR
jgi:hypothetical protein